MKTLECSKDVAASSTTENPPERRTGLAAHTPHRPSRVLIVDDDAAVRDALTEVLRTEHYEVVTASDGQQAVQRLLTARPDLVLLDLNLPGPDGWAAFASMEKRQPFLPVIVITARPSQFDRAVGLGIDAFMEKPLDFRRLLDAIAQLLNETEAQRQARLTNKDFVTWNLNTPTSSEGPSIRRPGLSFRPAHGNSPLNE